MQAAHRAWVHREPEPPMPTAPTIATANIRIPNAENLKNIPVRKAKTEQLLQPELRVQGKILTVHKAALLTKDPIPTEKALVKTPEHIRHQPTAETTNQLVPTIQHHQELPTALAPEAALVPTLHPAAAATRRQLTVVAEAQEAVAEAAEEAPVVLPAQAAAVVVAGNRIIQQF